VPVDVLLPTAGDEMEDEGGRIIGMVEHPPSGKGKRGASKIWAALPSATPPADKQRANFETFCRRAIIVLELFA
jgi:hypothetical protein